MPRVLTLTLCAWEASSGYPQTSSTSKLPAPLEQILTAQIAQFPELLASIALFLRHMSATVHLLHGEPKTARNTRWRARDEHDRLFKEDQSARLVLDRKLAANQIYDPAGLERRNAAAQGAAPTVQPVVPGEPRRSSYSAGTPVNATPDETKQTIKARLQGSGGGDDGCSFISRPLQRQDLRRAGSRRTKPTASLSEKWKCPICFGDARPSSLRIDGFLLMIRNQLAEEGRLSAKPVLVSVDSTWQVVIETNDDDDSDMEGEGHDGGGSGPTVPPRKHAKQPSAPPTVKNGPAREVIELPGDD